MIAKKCPHCGQLLNNAAFKCTRCGKWVDNEVFNRLCEEDVGIIKTNDLVIHTPSLIAAMVISLLKEDDYLKEAIQKQEEKTLNEQQQFNLLVFNSFCFFQAICSFVRMKQGCRHTITEMLKIVLLGGVAQLLNERVEHAPSLGVLQERGEVLYDEFEAILSQLGTDASSQLKASNAFASAVLGDDSPLSISGLSLYTTFMETFKHMRKEFSKMFLVEEEDFDWRAIVGI